MPILIQSEDTRIIELRQFCRVTNLIPHFDVQIAIPILQWLIENQIYPLNKVETALNAAYSYTAILNPQRDIALENATILENKLVSFYKAIEWLRRHTTSRLNQTPERITVMALAAQRQKNRPNDIMDRPIEEQAAIQRDYAPIPPTAVYLVIELSKLYYQLEEYEKSNSLLDYLETHVAERLVEGNEPGVREAVVWGLAANIICEMAKKPLSIDATTIETNNDGIHDKGGDEMSLGFRSGIEGSDDRGPLTTRMDPTTIAQCILRLASWLDGSAQGQGRHTLTLQRIWLLHWALWPLFRYYYNLVHSHGATPQGNAWNVLHDWFLHESNLTVTQFGCPHLMRYYAAYAILNRKDKEHLKLIVYAVKRSRSQYSDPITSFVEALFVEYAFNGAQEHLAKIGAACEADYFLAPIKSALEEQARLLIFEVYCRIHKSIDLNMISGKIQMPPEVAEKWIVNLIRTAKLEAKIDSEKNLVEMATQTPSVHQIIVEKTRSIMIRSNMMFQNLNRPVSQKTEQDGNVPPHRRQRPRNNRLGQRSGFFGSDDNNASTSHRFGNNDGAGKTITRASMAQVT